MNKLAFLKPKQIITRIIFTILFSSSIVFLSLTNYHFYYGMNSTNQDNRPLSLLIIAIVIAFIFAIGYILNLFLFKNKKVLNFMDSLESGGIIFCLLSTIIILLVCQDSVVFLKDYLSLFVTSSFTLLGFGLTITTILVSYIPKRLKNLQKDQQIKIIISNTLPYFLFFFASLIYTISTLLELQNIETSYFKATIYKSLFYSGTQIVFLIFKIIDIGYYYLTDLVNNSEESKK